MISVTFGEVVLLNSIKWVFLVCVACAGITTTGCVKYVPRPILPQGPPAQVSFESQRSLREYKVQLHKKDGEMLECTTPCSVDALSGSVSIGVFRRGNIKYLIHNVHLQPGRTSVVVHDGKLGMAITAIIFGISGAVLSVMAGINSYDGFEANAILAAAGAGLGLIAIPFSLGAGQNRLTVRSGENEDIYQRSMNIPW
jgi:hypothetical protein